MSESTWDQFLAKSEGVTEQNAHIYEYDVEQNKPIPVEGMKWKLSCKRVGNAVSGRFSKLTSEVELLYGDDSSKLLSIMDKNRHLAPKSISLIYLRNPIYIFLFHWIFWRYIHQFKSNAEMLPLLQRVLLKQSQEATDFFGSVTLIQHNNLLQKMMTTQSTGSIIAKLPQEGGTTSLKPSTGM